MTRKRHCLGHLVMPSELQPAKSMISYGQSVTWTDFNGNITRIEISGRSSMREAKRDALEHAKGCGWTPPRWWQWWRWNDTKANDLLA